MLEPIVLTAEGEKLYHPQPDLQENSKLSLMPGVHAVCQGWVDRRDVSETHRAIHCRTCGLRITFPRKVDTYGKLREHCRQRIEAAQPAEEETATS